MVIGCLRLSDVSVICRVVNPRRTSQKIWGRFLYGVYRPGEWLWLDSNGKMETRNPVEGYFDSEVPAIFNHFGVMAAWSRKSLIFLEICAVFGKTIPCGKIFKIQFQKFLSRRRLTDVLCFKLREIWPTESQWNRAFTWQKKTEFRLGKVWIYRFIFPL